MVDKLLSLFFGTKHERDVKRLWPLVHRINTFEPDMKKLTGDEMRAMTSKFRQRIDKGEPLDSLIPEAFALVREASVRSLGMRHFDVQLMGGVVLHQGKITEMKTGEGKTLVATLPVYLNALGGRGVHVVTVNDYLARRDAEWMGAIYKFLGLEVGVIQHHISPYDRQRAYRSDVTYGTNNEFGFDYLRDNMVEHQSLRVHRELNYAIVDEVDSILIDEARTPLIISGSTEESTKKYYLINKIILNLKASEDYEVNEKDRHVTLTEDGVRHVERLLKIDNLYDNRHIDTVHHVNQALKAHTLFNIDEDYIVKDGQVIIVDEFTGRLMPGRRYSDGLHQALEAKENVTIARESQTLATITFQNFFRMYRKLAGMTGTADTEAVEFKKIYNLDVVVIPTNMPMIRDDHPDKVYRTEREKYDAILDEIRELNGRSQPVLVGTISIEKSEKLSRLLQSKGVMHNVLNAKFHEQEARIIAETGRPAAVTIATNMAGRGTDIVLGGRKLYVDELEIHVPVHETGLWEEFKLAVLTSDFEKADRLSEQMIGQDNHKAKTIVRSGQEWTANHNRVVETGGLHILGTERHEARRIDNQLRGRSGRQGDPGSSRFYLSLEDDLMRLFGSERIGKIMQRLGMEEGQEIESPMVTKAIASAQKRVEGRNFDIRKHLLEYDDVMNSQREFIYKERDEILLGEDISYKFASYIEDVCRLKLEHFTGGKSHPEEWDLDGLRNWMRFKFGVELDLKRADPYQLTYGEFEKAITGALEEAYRQKEVNLGNEDMRILERMISLQIIDSKWRDHLYNMDEMRDGIWTLSYGERNPLVEYKIQGFNLFREMLSTLKEDILEYMMKVQVERVVREELPQPEQNIIGSEYHPEVEQFGAGGIPLSAQPAPVQRSVEPKREALAVTTGGVKRKKSRRSRRG
ncbi:MAG: preprotein translocase subunit SecA [Spirochaetes bacterium RBG_13_51_14]|nr:MAG: preprotein translocase subunit SecA [Spirochaetes bacterium RBG_13_51_14]